MSIKKLFQAMFCFEYIAPVRHFGINKKLRNQALLYDRTEGETFVSRGENVLYLTTYTAKYLELPTYQAH
jgi:hypothetical protein